MFRTNIQGWYAAGRCRAHLDNRAARPYLMYSAVNDSRTRPAHAAMKGFIAHIDDPIWKQWTAPCGFNCRCTNISLTEDQAKRRGLKPFPGVAPDPGWDYSPCHDGPDEGVRRAINGRNSRCGNSLSADPTGHVAAELAQREPGWCVHPVLKQLIDRLHGPLSEWDDPVRLARIVLGDDDWRRRSKSASIRNASAAGIDLPHGVILNAYTDRELDIWREALLLGRVIVHDASLRGWTEARIHKAGLFLHLLNESVGQLNPERGTFYRIVDTRPRGFGQRFREQHRMGRTIEYTVPTSVMRSREELEKGGYSGDMVIELDAISARDIQAFSIGNEPELLIPTGTQAIIVERDAELLWLEESEPRDVPSNKKFGANHVQ